MAAALVALLAFWPAWSALVSLWLRTKDYEFGVVVGAICLVWLGLRLQSVGRRVVEPIYWVLLPLAMLLVAWAVAFRANSDMLQQLLMPASLWLAILAGAGMAVAVAVWQPFAALYLALPWWDFLLPALQRATVIVTESLLRLWGIVTTIRGNTITIPEGRFDVAEGCAGKNYLMIAVTLGVFAGVMGGLAPRRRLLLVVIAVAAALLTNWLRVIVIVLAGHMTNMTHYLVAQEHLTFGTYLFVLPIVTILLAARKLGPDANPAAAAAALAQNSFDTHLRTELHGLGACVVLLTLALPAVLWLRRDATPGMARLLNMPVLSARWQGPYPVSGGWRPRFEGVADEVQLAYLSAAGPVEVYAGIYARQTPGLELVNYRNSVLAPGRWQLEDPRTEGLAGMTVEVAVRDQQRWLVAHVFQVGGQPVRSSVAAQLTYGFMSLTRRPASGVVAIAARCTVDCAAALRLVAEFSQMHGSQLRAALPADYMVGP